MGIYDPKLSSLDYNASILQNVTKQDVIDSYSDKLDAELMDEHKGLEIVSEATLEARCIHSMLELNFYSNQVR